MSIVQCEQCTRIYRQGGGDVYALNGVDLTIEAGQFIALMGPSGSGKSTLLHLLGGIDVPTTGRVVVDGVDIQTLNERELAVFRRRKVGIVYQFYNLIPTLTVRQNILLPLLLDHRKVDAERLQGLLEALGIVDQVDAFPAELSGGQAQRVAIARALINDPAIVLADEPTGNLDRRNSDATIDLLREANATLGQTILMITHDERIALEADRLMIIEDGRITRDEVLRR